MPCHQQTETTEVHQDCYATVHWLSARSNNPIVSVLGPAQAARTVLMQPAYAVLQGEDISAMHLFSVLGCDRLEFIDQCFDLWCDLILPE